MKVSIPLLFSEPLAGQELSSPLDPAYFALT